MSIRVLSDYNVATFKDTASMFFHESRNDSLTIDVDKFAARILEASAYPTVRAFVYMDSGACRGYAIINCSDDFTQELIGDMYQFYVRPDARGSEVARSLRDAVCKQFDEWGCAISYVCADTGIDDGRSVSMFRNLWAKAGFKPSGLTMSRVKGF